MIQVRHVYVERGGRVDDRDALRRVEPRVRADAVCRAARPGRAREKGRGHCRVYKSDAADHVIERVGKPQVATGERRGPPDDGRRRNATWREKARVRPLPIREASTLPYEGVDGPVCPDCAQHVIESVRDDDEGPEAGILRRGDAHRSVQERAAADAV